MSRKTTQELEGLLDRYQNGDLSRRHFLSLTAAAALSVGVFAGGRRNAYAAAGSVRYDGWGGTAQDAFRKFAFEPFSQKTGIEVVEGTFGGELEILTKIRTSRPGDFNIVHSSGVTWYKRYVDLGWNSEIDESKVPNLQLTMEATTRPLRQITPKAISAAPYNYGTTGIAYNTKHITEEQVRSLGPGILLEKSLKGKIAASSEIEARVWYAALQTGQNPNDIKNMDEVWNKCRETLGLVKKIWESGAELQDLLSREEVFVADAWSGRVAILQEQGFPIGYYEPPGVLSWMDDLFVLKGSPMAECEELLNFMLDPEVSNARAEASSYPSSLDPTKVKFSEKVKALPGFDPTGKLEGFVWADPNFWAPRFDEFEKEWSRIRKGF